MRLLSLLLLLIVGVCQAAELVPNDPTADNGPAIVEHIQQAKPLPAGTFYASSTIDTGAGVGGALLGNGAPDFARADGAWKYGPVTVIIDARPKDNVEPLLRIRRGRFRIADVGLVGVPIRHTKERFEGGAGPLIEITQIGAQWPVGQTDIERVTLANSEIGLLHADDGTGGGHCDHTTATMTTHQVDYPVIIDDNQSVNHQFNLFCAGDGHTIITAKQGGRIEARIQTVGHWQRWLTVGDAEKKTFPSKHNGFYFLTVLMDGGDSVAAPYEEMFAYEWSRPVVKITGIMADSAEIKGDPIVLNPSNVSVRLERTIKPPYVWPEAEKKAK